LLIGLLGIDPARLDDPLTVALYCLPIAIVAGTFVGVHFRLISRSDSREVPWAKYKRYYTLLAVAAVADVLALAMILGHFRWAIAIVFAVLVVLAWAASRGLSWGPPVEGAATSGAAPDASE
jgi:hypothetical protein